MVRNTFAAFAPTGARGIRAGAFLKIFLQVAFHASLPFSQPALRIEGDDLNSERLVQTQHEVHVLDGLAGRPFHQVIERGEQDEPVIPGVDF